MYLDGVSNSNIIQHRLNIYVLLNIRANDKAQGSRGHNYHEAPIAVKLRTLLWMSVDLNARRMRGATPQNANDLNRVRYTGWRNEVGLTGRPSRPLDFVDSSLSPVSTCLTKLVLPSFFCF